MAGNIAAVRGNADAITRVETTLGGLLYELSFAAEYGHGSTGRAVESLQESHRHADRAVVAAAAGNAVMAAAHEARAAAAQSDAVRMLGRADGYADDLGDGLTAACAHADDALGHATSLVGLDDASPAAEIHARIADQPDSLRALLERVREVQARVPRSRDPDELRVAAEHFTALRHELEEASGRAQALASDALGYGNTV